MLRMTASLRRIAKGASLLCGLALLAFASSGAAQEPAIAPPTYEVVEVPGAAAPVVAGTAEPGAIVELLEGTAIRGTAEANQRGEWAMALDLDAAGQHQLSLRVTSPDGRYQIVLGEPVVVTIMNATEPIGPDAVVSTSPMRQVVVRRGDTLWDLAVRYYGTGLRYTEILEANRDRIASPRLIRPGQVLFIP